MSHLRQSILILCILALLGTSPLSSFCSSCGPKPMDCCRQPAPARETLSAIPCCDFVIVAGSEPHPGRVSTVDPNPNPFAAAPPGILEAWAAPPGAPAAHPQRPGTYATDTSPAIFLLNVTLIC